MVRIIAIQHPGIITNHTLIPNSFIPFFHWLDILAKFFTLLITNCSKIFREKFKVEGRKCIFKDMRHPISLYATNYSATLWCEFDLKFSKKLEQIHLNACQARSSNALNAFSNSGSSKTSRICGPTKIPSFNFALLSSVKFLQRNFKTIRILFCHSFH